MWCEDEARRRVLVALWSVLVHVLLTDLSPSPGRFLVSSCRTDISEADHSKVMGSSKRSSYVGIAVWRFLQNFGVALRGCLLMVLGQQQHPHKVVLVLSFVGLVVRTTHTHNS